MPAAIKNLVRDKGETMPLEMVYRQGRNLPPVDLTGCAAGIEFLDRVGGTPVALTTANGGIALGGVAGTISVDLAHASYIAMQLGDYCYELYVTFAGGQTRHLVRGKWTIV